MNYNDWLLLPWRNLTTTKQQQHRRKFSVNPRLRLFLNRTACEEPLPEQSVQNPLLSR